jgi:formamidopyrimidine-DNA glycosylase
MPELPDVTVYIERIQSRFGGRKLDGLRIQSAFLLRTYEPPAAEFVSRRLEDVRRIGKRIALCFEGDRVAVVHLMVAGRFRVQSREKQLHKKMALCAFDFGEESLVLNEFAKKKRASLHLMPSWQAALSLSRGGLEPLDAGLGEFAAALRRENRTLKRALTDPSIFSGIGNAYSDEMAFWAQLSPVARTGSLDDEQVERLYVACRQTLLEWTELLRRRAGSDFPTEVTAFHEEMAVHGRFRKPCRVCGTEVQRIVYAENEVNYCPRCQTGGRLLADRALSRLLHADWPRHIDEWEEVGRAAKRG